MHTIPQQILILFIQEHPSAEESLLTWLLENEIVELNCCHLHIISPEDHYIRVPPSQIVKIAEIIGKSLVHTVSFRFNNLGSHGSHVAANLTREHSKIHTVDFSSNEFGSHGPEVAANLTGEYSKVHTVDFSYNDLRSYGPAVAVNLTGAHSKVQIVNFMWNNFGWYAPAVAANLTGKHSKVHTVDFICNYCAMGDPEIIKELAGTYSKIVNCPGIRLTAQQFKENAVNLLLQFAGLHMSSLEVLAFKAQYEVLKARLKENPLLLPHYITLLGLIPKKIRGINVLIQALLLHANILKINDILKNKTEEIVQYYIAANCAKTGMVDQMPEMAQTLTFSHRKKNNDERYLSSPKFLEQERIAVSEQTVPTLNRNRSL